MAKKAEQEKNSASAQMDETGSTMKRLMAHSSGLDTELEMMVIERKAQESEIEVSTAPSSYVMNVMIMLYHSSTRSI